MINRVGRMMQEQFATGKPFREQLTSIKNVNNQAAGNMQDALVRLLDGNDPMMSSRASRMAASPEALTLLKTLPAAGVGLGALAVGDVVAGEESLANKGMDMLAMVPGGMYGMRNQGTPAGRVGAALIGAGIGKLGSDAIQGGVGGVF